MKDIGDNMKKFFLSIQLPTKTYQSGKRVTCRGGKPIFYEDSELKALRDKLTGLLISHAPDEPIEGAVRLGVKWLFPLAKGKQDGDYKTTKPDTDNLQKLLKDCMTDAGFWLDDAQVVAEIVEKFYSNTQGIFIYVMEV